MAHAILFPTPMSAKESGAMKGKRSLAAKDLPFSEALLSQAPAVRKYAPTLVEKVRDGFPLDDLEVYRAGRPARTFAASRSTRMNGVSRQRALAREAWRAG